MVEVRPTEPFVCYLILKLSRFTGMRGAVVTQALNDAGYPDGHLPPRDVADRLTGTGKAADWKRQLAPNDLDAAMAVTFLRMKYRNGMLGGLLLMWHPTTRWLYARLTGPRKAAEPDFHRWIDKKLLDGATRFARIRTMVDQHRKEANSKQRVSPIRRAGHLPDGCPIYFPKILVLSDCLHDDGYEPNFSDWRFEPNVLSRGAMSDGEEFVFNLSNLPDGGNPHGFIGHIFGGYIFGDFLFTIGKRGARHKVTGPRSSVPKRLGILGDKGRRWRSLLRMPEFGTGRTKSGPFESSRRRKPRKK